MKQKLYKNYVDDIAHYLKQERSSNFTGFNEGFRDNPKMLWFDKHKNENNFRSLSTLSSFSNLQLKYSEKLGAHPSFRHLKGTDQTEYHYVTSVFIDIKNSTGLFKKYPPHIVANICRTIQLAAIHTCWYFDGYIQRLQGDGLMVYFGSKEQDKEKAVENALMASSFISYFVKNDLRNLFDEQGVKRIYTRIGIDFGDDQDTLWHNAGVGDSSEVTTTSLHTSLACKMQTQATSNGIVAGDNILPYKPDHQDYFSYKVYSSNGKETQYVYENHERNLRYKQHDFNWERYLKNHPAIESDEEGNLTFKGNPIIPTPNIENNIKQLEENATNYKPYCK